MDELGLIRVGIVSQVDVNIAAVRVIFDDLDSDDSSGLLSDWLPVIQHGSLIDTGYWLPRIGSQVVCAMQSNGIERGYVIGSIYSDADIPPASGAGIWYKRFADGTVIEYDPGQGVTIDTPLKVVIKGSMVEIN
jgi:phage baseplate assembly protein V